MINEGKRKLQKAISQAIEKYCDLKKNREIKNYEKIYLKYKNVTGKRISRLKDIIVHKDKTSRLFSKLVISLNNKSKLSSNEKELLKETLKYSDRLNK